MKRQRKRRLPLHQRLALDCEHSLLEAAELNASSGEWLPTDENGREFIAEMHVDEELDCPVVELWDEETGTLQRRFRVKVLCLPIGKQSQDVTE